MKPLKVEGLLKILKARKLKLRLADDGTPRVVGPKDEITDALVASLKAHRDELIAWLRGVHGKA